MTSPAASHTELAAHYFDGRSSRAHPVRLRVAAGQLMILGEPVVGQDGFGVAQPVERIARRVSMKDVRWSEPTRGGPRVAHIDVGVGGGSLESTDPQEWDVFLAAQGVPTGWVAKAQLRWRWAALALALCLGTVFAGYVWGLPLAARVAVAFVPASVDESMGAAVLASMEGDEIRASGLSAERQQALRSAFERLVAASHGGPGQPARPPYTLHFRASTLGPNAFALPGGAVVVTDELVTVVKDDNALLGVMAHELGHVRHRHGMRALVQTGLLAAATSVLLGDFSSVLAGVPLWLGQAAYSRDAEREADDEAIRMLKAGGISPLVMVGFFEQVRAASQKGPLPDNSGRTRQLGIAFSSHPSDEERVARFRAAAAAR